MIHTHSQFHDLEDEARINTTFIGLRYTGGRSTMPPDRPQQRGGWPGDAVFQGAPGDGNSDDDGSDAPTAAPMQLGIVPDTLDEESVDGGTVAGLEALSDFAVVYDPTALATTILQLNALPVPVFGGDRKTPDYAVRSRVYDRLGLDDRGRQAPEAEAELREALAEVAGIEDPNTDDTIERQSREDDLVDAHPRSTLLSAASELDVDVEGGLTSATKRELAAAMVEHSKAEVREAVKTATGDGGGDSDE
jgi:hypothetical protein